MDVTERRIALGSDHAGFSLKEALKDYLQAHGWEVVDLGCPDENRVDYPSVAATVVEAMENAKIPRGILCCGSGVGMSMAANRFPGIRAVLAHDVWIAQMSRRHNNSNVLCLGGRVLAPPMAIEILATWLVTPFEGERHAHRVALMDTIKADALHP